MCIEVMIPLLMNMCVDVVDVVGRIVDSKFELKNYCPPQFVHCKHIHMIFVHQIINPLIDRQQN